ncbi:50S ribosomal protein L11 methyltransferase [Rhodoplanes sp. Z2-YC6860]|uniref:50S ribosomal protein L11 methyltransferase n=1 Tax=Rhodoplanes sp. Z2-YC6860 TaxID=674703 RepID=UPI00078C1174|nr:50S ribosomal protein L11 methyltransferase [Rhodoplanes sp. Z2-YC6860]AMN44227.1 ribosomal L11 methyltransferase [Rhodoplanes sp. Z2-YC6860]
MTKSQAKQQSAADAGSEPTFVARLIADEHTSRRIADLLSESLDPSETACAAFEQPDGRWQVDVHFRNPPDEASLREIVALAGGEEIARAVTFERVAPRNWVKESLIGLRPVAAGRFVVHGAHDRDRVPSHCISIEIEAATAFGTGHHGTTRGCLLALDHLARRYRPRHILDLGTGSGILAIAAAKLFRVPVLATDIDARSAQTARDNARLNGVGAFVTAIHAADLRAPEIMKRAPFDLVMSNILLRPLQRLAAPVARQLEPNARIILSGILKSQANAALTAYRSQGLMLERSFPLDGWFTPVMVAASG